MKKALLTGLLLVYSLGSYANTPSYQQNQMIDTLTQYSAQMIDMGSVYSTLMSNMTETIRLNNPQLAICLDRKFSKDGYYSFRRGVIEEYVMSKTINQVKLEAEILTPEVVYAINGSFSQAINEASNFNYKPSVDVQQKLANFLFNSTYKDLRDAVLTPINTNLNDSPDGFKIKASGAGAELGMRYWAWGLHQCGL